MKKLLLVINPHSGFGSARTHALDALDIFTRAGYLVTCVPTQYEGHAAEIIRAYGAAFDRVVACGGDGTVNECLNGLMTLPRPPAFGILPAGTVNDYAYSLNIPNQLPKAAEIAADDQLFSIDIGNINGRFFTYVAAFGLFTDVTYETDQDAKNLIGAAAYVLEGAKRLATPIPKYNITVEHDSGIVIGDYILGMISNSISIAGLRTAHTDALLDDGELEICLIRYPETLTEMQDVLEILLNLKQISALENSFITYIRTRSVRVHCDEPLAWTVDGEQGGRFKTAEIHACRQALTIAVGGDPKAFSILE